MHEQVKEANPNIFKRVLARITRKKPLIEKNQSTACWHCLIEGGTLVRFRKNKGSMGFYVIGDKAVYAVVRDRPEAEKAVEHMKARFGPGCMCVEDGSENGKTLFFIYRPINFPESAGLNEKYCEMISVMLDSDKGYPSLRKADVRNLAATPLETVIKEIERL